MPLTPAVLTALQTTLEAAFALGVADPPAQADSDTIAAAVAVAYSDYALNGISCSGQTPTLVMLSDLSSGLQDAFRDTNPDALTAATEWQMAFDAFWDGALFGPGIVTTVTGSLALRAALTSIFSQTSDTRAEVANQVGQALDDYTKTVTVQDSSIPCGPAPIT